MKPRDIKRGKFSSLSHIYRNNVAETVTLKTLNGTMKLLVLALAFALVLTGEALKCHHCVPKSAGESCELAVEKCKLGKNACAATKFTRSPYGQYQKCMSMTDCQMLKMNAYINIKCCTDDMCNTF